MDGVPSPQAFMPFTFLFYLFYIPIFSALSLFIISTYHKKYCSDCGISLIKFKINYYINYYKTVVQKNIEKLNKFQ